MDGILALLLLILISALPVLPLLLWIRRCHFPIRLSWFLLAFLAGAFSLGLAALIQMFIPWSDSATLGNLIGNIFFRIALTEEISRFLALLALFGIGRRFHAKAEDSVDTIPARSFGALTGLIAGLGFAIIETAVYGSANFRIALIRAITAAPLHGACGSRVGLTAVGLKTEPVRAVLNFLSAATLHGMYNFMILNPSLPAVFPVLVAFSALGSSLLTIRANQETVP
jgi:RsiW-degrading membrane proteinase PrsW (M82 family)